MTFPNKAVRKTYWRYYCQSRKRDLIFEITKPEFIKLVTADHCFYCGCEPYQTMYGIPILGIDRKENSIGYIYSNCVPCCKDCNWKKGRLSVDEFLKRNFINA